MTCPDCERYKESARNWRHKAYELSGRPLPWEGGDTWVGLTAAEKIDIVNGAIGLMDAISDAEAKLKEKNT